MPNVRNKSHLDIFKANCQVIMKPYFTFIFENSLTRVKLLQWCQMSFRISQFSYLSTVCGTVCWGWHRSNIKVLHHWPFWGESTCNQWFPAQMASNLENVSMSWHHAISCPNAMPSTGPNEKILVEFQIHLKLFCLYFLSYKSNHNVLFKL